MLQFIEKGDENMLKYNKLTGEMRLMWCVKTDTSNNSETGTMWISFRIFPSYILGKHEIKVTPKKIGNVRVT
jgi:hypothetical protein